VDTQEKHVLMAVFFSYPFITVFHVTLSLPHFVLPWPPFGGGAYVFSCIAGTVLTLKDTFRKKVRSQNLYIADKHFVSNDKNVQCMNSFRILLLNVYS
jgi:hypothetical protein